MYFPKVEDPAEKIIVFKSYDTILLANLAKTKLDAYGIPCFLSEENFATWYPLFTQSSGVRLHIFERDQDRVNEIMEERFLSIDEPVCPRCQSGKVTIEDIQKPDNWHLVTAILFVLSPRKKVYHCHDCGQEWD